LQILGQPCEIQVKAVLSFFRTHSRWLYFMEHPNSANTQWPTRNGHATHCVQNDASASPSSNLASNRAPVHVDDADPSVTSRGHDNIFE
jgi:hypothetical protein